MFKVIKGFDAEVYFFTDCKPESYQYRPCDYGTGGDVDFWFKLFSMENGKVLRWNIEPPHYSIKVNSAWSGDGTNYGGLEGYRTQEDDPKLEKSLDEAIAKYSEFFCAFELDREIAPGIRLYKDDHLVVFNPNRPDIWIPVTVKEIMEVKLAYNKVKHEIDSINYEKMVAGWAKMNFNPDPEHTMRPKLYQMIKKEYENFTAEELSLPAYSGASEESGISKINVRGDGRAVVRFNPACWDRSLPDTAIQFMTFY